MSAVARLAAPLAWGLLFVASLVLLATIVVAVPPNMDEYVHYHPIACAAFPLARLHDLRAGCDGALDLELFGRWLPLRSYRYIGASTALWYLPLYELWPSRHGPRLLGVLSLLLTALGVARLARVPWRVAWLTCVLCVPLAFLLIVDTGPVGFQVAASVWAVVLLRFLLAARATRRSLAASAALGLLLFLAIEQKPFFVYQLPAIALLGVLLALLDARDQRWTAGGAALRLAPAAIVLALSTVLLFGAKTRRGYAYFYDLARVAAGISVLDLGAQLEHLRSGHLLEYLTDFRTFGHRVYGFHAWAVEPATLLYWLCVVTALGLALRRPRRRAVTRALAACGLAFVGTLYLVNLNRLAWGGHHVIGAWPFLATALAIALGEEWRAGRRATVLAFFVVVAASQGWALHGIVTRRPDPVSSWDLVAIHDYLDGTSELARDHVTVALDWGSYYVKSLYGPEEQLVLYAEPLREVWHVRRLRDLAKRLDRKLAFVRRRDSTADVALLDAEIPHLVRRDVPGVAPDAQWQLWVEE